MNSQKTTDYIKHLMVSKHAGIRKRDTNYGNTTWVRNYKINSPKTTDYVKHLMISKHTCGGISLHVLDEGNINFV